MTSFRHLRPEEIKVALSTLYILQDGTTVPRRSAYLTIRDCVCGKPMYTEREVKFQEKIGKCFSCTTRNSLDFAIRTRGCCVHPDDLEEELRHRRRVAPSSEVRYWLTTFGYYKVYWTFDPAEVYLQIGRLI